jgi:hypothetical protein
LDSSCVAILPVRKNPSRAVSTKMTTMPDP